MPELIKADLSYGPLGFLASADLNVFKTPLTLGLEMGFFQSDEGINLRLGYYPSLGNDYFSLYGLTTLNLLDDDGFVWDRGSGFRLASYLGMRLAAKGGSMGIFGEIGYNNINPAEFDSSILTSPVFRVGISISGTVFMALGNSHPLNSTHVESLTGVYIYLDGEYLGQGDQAVIVSNGYKIYLVSVNGNNSYYEMRKVE
jgi:hypothetical protein